MKDILIINILEKLKTIKPSLTYARILKHSNILRNITNNMAGGGTNRKILIDDKNDTKEFSIKYKNVDYIFHTHHDKYSVFYRLYQKDSDDECIFIIVEKDDKKDVICEIHNLSYDSTCTPLAEISDRNGSSLLKIALKLINTIKDRYKIKRIQLTDNSVKNCKGKQIRLNMMLTLLTGLTWYGKYGFYPKNRKIQKEFDSNNKIINKTLLSAVSDFKQLIINSQKKSKSKLNLNKILRNYDRAIEDKALLKNYLKYFLKEYDKTCDIFYYFYDKLYMELKLMDMYGETFVKDIIK